MNAEMTYAPETRMPIPTKRYCTRL
jgi:hypothetical protein